MRVEAVTSKPSTPLILDKAVCERSQTASFFLKKPKPGHFRPAGCHGISPNKIHGNDKNRVHSHFHIKSESILPDIFRTLEIIRPVDFITTDNKVDMERFKRMNWFGTQFGQGQTGLTGLDIGTGSVKLVTLQKDGQGLMAASAAYAVVEPAQDAALCEENTLRAIRECFKKAGPAATRNVVCGISGQVVSVRGFSFPPLPEEAIEQAVKLEAQQTCALDISKSVIDYQLLSDETEPTGQDQKQGRKGFFVASLQDAIAQKIQLAQQAQIKTVLMDMDSLAILNCISHLSENKTTESIAALDIGHTAATMTILGSDGVPFVRMLSGSAEQILSMVSLNTQKSVAEIKKSLINNAVPEDSDLEIELKNAATKLITDAIETLRFYSLQQNINKVSRLYLCGGFSLYKPFVRLIQKHLPVECTVFDPMKVVRCPDHGEIRDIFSQFGPAMTVATGLAMRSINYVHN